MDTEFLYPSNFLPSICLNAAKLLVLTQTRATTKQGLLEYSLENHLSLQYSISIGDYSTTYTGYHHFYQVFIINKR